MNPEPADAESRRLSRLHALNVLDTGPEPLFDELASLASSICGTPIAAVALMDADRLWFKSLVGLQGVTEVSRQVAFCDHTIRSDEVLEVEDLRADGRFEHNPAVPGLQFYAGAPLVMPGGERIGTLCVFDQTPRRLSPAQREALGRLSRMAVQALELRERWARQTEAISEARANAAAAAERRLRGILDTQTEWVVQCDDEGHLLYLNPAAAAGLGAPRGGSAAWRLVDAFTLEDRPRAERQIHEVLDDGVTATLDARMVDPSGSTRSIAWTFSRQRGESGEALLHATGRDVSLLVASQAGIERQRATLRSLIDALPVTVGAVDARGCLVAVNPAFVDAFAPGSSESELVGRPLAEVVPEPEVGARRPWVERVEAGETVRFEVARHTPAGQRLFRIVYLPRRDDAGRPDGFFGIGEDITEQRQEHSRMQALLETDGLTGLSNRVGFERGLQKAVGSGGHEPVALLYCDLDRFKAVNDTHGHPAGDLLLREAAERLKRQVRPTDVVARVGGDEFAVVLFGVDDVAVARRVGEAIVESLSRPFELSAQTVVSVGSSVGIAIGWPGRHRVDDLVHRADAMLLQAKRAGRARVRVDGDSPETEPGG